MQTPGFYVDKNSAIFSSMHFDAKALEKLLENLELEELGIVDCEIEVKSFSRLTTLSRLWYISFHGSNFLDDFCMRSLEDLIQVQHLVLSDTNVTDDVIEDLRLRLPACKVERL